MKKLNTKKQIAHDKWVKATKEVLRCTDALILNTKEIDEGYWKKRERVWNQKAKEYRAIYLKSV